MPNDPRFQPDNAMPWWDASGRLRITVRPYVPAVGSSSNFNPADGIDDWIVPPSARSDASDFDDWMGGRNSRQYAAGAQRFGWLTRCRLGRPVCRSTRQLVGAFDLSTREGSAACLARCEQCGGVGPADLPKRHTRLRSQ